MQMKLSLLSTRQRNSISALWKGMGVLTNSLKYKYSIETTLCGKGESIFTNLSATVMPLCNFQCNLWYQMHSQES